MSGGTGDFAEVSVGCGQCGSPNVFMETCENLGGPTGHHWVIGSECKNCGLRNDSPGLVCHDCHPEPT